MTSKLTIGIETSLDLGEWDVGEKFLSPLFSTEKLSPQRISSFGEVSSKHGIDINNIYDCRSCWGLEAKTRVQGVERRFRQGINWKRTRTIKSSGSVRFAGLDIQNIPYEGNILFEAEYRKTVDWLSLFLKWCDIARPDSALMHIMGVKNPKLGNDVKADVEKSEVEIKALSRFKLGKLYCEFTAGELNSRVCGMTDLGWASFFGGKFAHEVNVNKIRASGFLVREVGGGFMIMITDDIDDVFQKNKLFFERKKILKSLFDVNLFLLKD